MTVTHYWKICVCHPRWQT